MNDSFIGERIGYRGYLARNLADGESINLLIRDGADARGEIYECAGATTITLDPDVNSLLNDTGRHFAIYQFFGADAVTLTRVAGHPIQVMNDGATVESLTLEGAGYARVEIRNQRYMVHWEPTVAHNDTILANGLDTSRQKYSPAQLRTASLGAISASAGVAEVSTDGGYNDQAGTTQVFYSAVPSTVRSVNLQNTNRWEGEVVRVTRTGAGAALINVRDHNSNTLISLAQDEWADFVFFGGTARLAFQMGTVMTKPQFTPLISLENMLQMGFLLVSITVGYAFVKSTSDSNSRSIADIETRLRVVEANTLRQGANFSNLSRSLDKIEAQQGENNRLLRELLARTGGRVMP